HRSHRLIQALGGMAEKGDARSLHAKHAGHPRLRAIVDGEELLAAAHAPALEGAHAGGSLVVRSEPRRLAAPGHMGAPLETDELALVEEGHGGGRQAGRVSRAAAPAAWSSGSGVSGLMEQSGPRRSQRPFISAMARRARLPRAAAVAGPDSRLAGGPPPPRRPPPPGRPPGAPRPAAKRRARRRMRGELGRGGRPGRGGEGGGGGRLAPPRARADRRAAGSAGIPPPT